MSKPTAGEWELGRTETDESLLYARDEKSPHCIRPIARVMHPDGSAEGIANAFLLRESKNLLEACRLAVRYLDERDGDRSRPNPVRELLASTVAAATEKSEV